VAMRSAWLSVSSAAAERISALLARSVIVCIVKVRWMAHGWGSALTLGASLSL
jgi:hypothetical protein